MLSYFRKHAKSNMAKALYITLAVTFVVGFGILGNLSGDDEKETKTTDPIFIVNGDEISAMDFARAYEQAKRAWMIQMEKMYGQVPEDMLDTEALKQDVMDKMINMAILLQEAKKLGIKVSENDINTKIGEYPYFRDQTGKFSPELYKNALNQAGRTSEQFEKEVADQLQTQRVINMIVAPVQVDEGELKDYFGKVKSEINLSFFMVNADERYKDLEPTKQEIEQYFKSHPREFDWPETRKMKFFKFSIPDYEKSVTVTEADLKDYYDKAKDRYVSAPEQGHFRHVLVKLAENASEAEVTKAKEKADKIHKEIVAGADFSEQAKKFSDDTGETGTAANGGDLGFAARGSFIPEFEAAGYALPIGGVSVPVRSKFGFHIIKLEEIKPPEYSPLSEVKDVIRKDVVRAKAHVLAGEKAEKVQKDAKELGMDKAGAKNSLKIYSSDWFKKRDNDLQDLPESRDISEQAFYINKDEVSDVIPGDDNLYIIQIIELKDPHQASLEEAAGKVARKLKPELALKKTKDDARKWLEEIKKGASIEAEAAKAGAKVKETGFFQVGARSVPEIGFATEDLAGLIVNLSAKNPAPQDVYGADAKVYVFRVKSDKPADMTKYSEEKDQVMSELLAKKQQVAFDKFIEERKTGKVEIKEDILKKIE